MTGPGTRRDRGPKKSIRPLARGCGAHFHAEVALKDLISLADLSEQEVQRILARAGELKAMHKRGERHRPLEGKTLGMFFEKPSLRTRVTFEVGMSHLGGHAIMLTPSTSPSACARPWPTWRATSSAGGPVWRTFSHQLVVDLARVRLDPGDQRPDDLLHPCQILADIFTLVERLGDVRGAKVAYLGDGNNVANSWINGAVKTGIDLVLACPEGYEPDAGVLGAARAWGEPRGRRVRVLRDPREAVRGPTSSTRTSGPAWGRRRSGRSGSGSSGPTR
jgi:ornithine carbamoyltransferase